MEPRIFPCVPLPEPGAPNKRTVRYFMRGDFAARGSGSRPSPPAFGSLSVLVLDRDLVNFAERNHHVLRRRAFPDLQKQFVRLDLAQALAGVFAACGFDVDDLVALGYFSAMKG